MEKSGAVINGGTEKWGSFTRSGDNSPRVRAFLRLRDYSLPPLTADRECERLCFIVNIQ